MSLKEKFSQEPSSLWLKEIIYPDGKKGLYLPIDKVEDILDSLSDSWSVDIKQTIIINHSVSVVVRVTINIGDKSYFNDGGATEVATHTNPIQTLFPKAISMATKNACKKWGRLFGRDVERQVDEVIMDVPKSEFDTLIELFKKVEQKVTKEERVSLNRIIENKEVKSYDKAIDVLNKYLMEFV